MFRNRRPIKFSPNKDIFFSHCSYTSPRKIPQNNSGRVTVSLAWILPSWLFFLQRAAKRNWVALIPIINSWSLWDNTSECQATDFCTVVHRLNSRLPSFVPISLRDSIGPSRHPASSQSHLLLLTFCLPRSLFRFFVFNVLFLHYCFSPLCPFL